ncbi:MAG: hypothetical protein AAGF31_08140 [Planctomycetota bacterium]
MDDSHDGPRRKPQASSAADSAETNPFASPQSAASPMPVKRSRGSAIKLVLVVLLGVVLVPIAAAICGFCCCTVGLFAVGWPASGDIPFVVLFPGGAVLGAAAVIYGLIRWYRHLVRDLA